MRFYFFFILLLIPFFLLPLAYAHTVDSVGEYRVEIGWMNEPVVSSETNAIEFYASPLKPGLELEDQKFEDGITGLKKTVKLQLVYKDQKITLPLSPDHNVAGKYYAFVNPTVSGFYQANILGTIQDTPISLSMHPPKVDERSYIEFPIKETEEKNQMLKSQDILRNDLNSLKSEIAQMQDSNSFDGLEYLGIAFGIAGVGIASGVVAKTRSKL